MNSLLLSYNKESMLNNLVKLFLTFIKDAFSHIGGKLGEIPNQIRGTVSRHIIRFLLKNLSSHHHHHHHVTPLLCHHATPLLPMDHHLYHIICHPSSMHGSTLSSYYPSPLYVDHILSNIVIAIREQKKI